MMLRMLLVALTLMLGQVAHAQESCRKVGSVCTAVNQTRTINGVQVFRECWEYQDTYECRNENAVSDCAPLRARGCTQRASSCAQYDKNKNCVMYEQHYDCPDKPQGVVEQTVCEAETFCQDGGAGCFDTSAPPDQDLGRAAAMMEVSREAGRYGLEDGKVELFKGFMNECSVKVLGGSNIKSCCRALGGGEAFTNYRMTGSNIYAQAGREVVVGVPREASRELVAAGSRYVYDALYGEVARRAAEQTATAAAGAVVADGAFNPTFSFFGASFQVSAAGGIQITAFDPYSAMAQIMIMLIQEWLSCDQEENMMGMKRGQNLCVYVDSYCAKDGVGVCVEMKERHCCFNSKLSKIINRQGREQLGMPLNTCAGLSSDQIQAIDFSRVDFSEFIADVVPRDVPPSELVNRMTETIRTRMTPRTQGPKSYYDQ